MKKIDLNTNVKNESKVNTSASPLLSVKNLSVAFEEESFEKHRHEKSFKTVLHNINFNLFENDFLGIVGESGSGKSVCALAIMGLLPRPSAKILSGSIRLGNQELLGNKKLRLDKTSKINFRGRRIAMIFQEPSSALNPVQRVGDQLAEVFTLHFPEMSTDDIKKESLALLKQVGISEPEQRLIAYPHLLSGGICQRIMIAMALACKPDILIADEPSTALDVNTQKKVLELIKSLQAQIGFSVIFISHDLALISQLCENVIVMEQGHIREQNNIGEIFLHPQHPYSQALLSSIVHLETPKLSLDNQLAPLYDQAPLLKVESIGKRYPIRGGLFSRVKNWHTAVENVSFELFQGEVLGLVGESGCGKSTLGRLILKLEAPSKGHIKFQQQDLSEWQNKNLRTDMQVIFQDSNESLNPRHTIGTLLEEPFVVHKLGTPSERKQWVRELLNKVALDEDCVDRFPHQFSGGQRQRIGIARAIALKPKLLICDEPVSALDVSTQSEILKLLMHLKIECDLSLLFISHDLAVVKHVADRVMVMQKGKILEINDADKIYKTPQNDYTKRLIDAIPRINVNQFS